MTVTVGPGDVIVLLLDVGPQPAGEIILPYSVAVVKLGRCRGG